MSPRRSKTRVLPSGLTSTSIQVPSSTLIGTCRMAIPGGALTSHLGGLGGAVWASAWARPKKAMKAAATPYFMENPRWSPISSKPAAGRNDGDSSGLQLDVPVEIVEPALVQVVGREAAPVFLQLIGRRPLRRVARMHVGL